MKKTIDVHILGQKIRIKHEDEGYIRQLEDFVNEKVRVQETDPRSAAGLQLAIRGMITIADEYFAAKKEREKVEKQVEDRARKLIEIIDQKAALLGDG